MNLRRWLLPHNPDVLGMLRKQAAVTVEGMDALVRWTRGSADAADALRACEHRADDRKREVREALTTAFTTPLEPEDLFELSRGMDEVINGAKNAVREAEVMGTGPDAAMADMADDLNEGTRRLAEALTALAIGEPRRATAAADSAVSSQRHLEHTYRSAMSALVDVEDQRELAARRELYRRMSRTSDQLVDVAERVWYAILKGT